MRLTDVTENRRSRPVVSGLAAMALGVAFAIDVTDRLRAGRPADPSGTLALLSSSLGTAACAWLLAVSAACCLARRAGFVGELGRTLWRALTPDAMRPLLALGLGLSLLAPLAAARPGGAAHVPATHLVSMTVPDADVSARRTPPWPDPTFGTRGELVQVIPGDTLWDLSAERLGPDADARQICAEWPRWLEANRAAVEDPDLIYPGQVLTAPRPYTHQGFGASDAPATQEAHPTDESWRSAP